MRLVFKSITLCRFRSFIEETTLAFDSAGNGLYFLKGKNKTSTALGSNGAGKSSIISALYWCLMGKTEQGLKNPDVIPWTGKGTSKVSVYLLVDNKEYTIARTINPNLLTINDQEAGQAYVDQLINIPQQIIPYTIILGQRQSLFFDLTASEKLKLFNEVLQLERWDERSNQVSEQTKSMEIELSGLQSEHDSCLNAQKQAHSDFETLKVSSTAWEAERTTRLANANKSLSTLRKQIDAVMSERDTADLKLDRALTELKALSPICLKLSLEERTLLKLVTNLLKDEKHVESETIRLNLLLNEISKEHCPTCSQPLKSKEQQKQLEKDIKKQIRQMGLADIQDARADAATKYAQCETQLDIQEKAKEQFEKNAEDARTVLDRILPRIAAWEATIVENKKQIETDQEENNPYTEQLQSLRRRRDQNKAKDEQIKQSIDIKSAQCERTRFWIKGFRDVKLLIVEEILQELQLTTQGLLEQFGLIGWQVTYDIEKENKSGTISKGLNIVVLSPANKKPVKWECWSGGEGQRLRALGAIVLSSVLMNHIGVSVNLMMLDEPTESLSSEGVQDLVELLASYARDAKKAVWLVDHHTVESAKFVQTIEVTKDKSGSSLQIV